MEFQRQILKMGFSHSRIGTPRPPYIIHLPEFQTNTARLASVLGHSRRNRVVVRFLLNEEGTAPGSAPGNLAPFVILAASAIGYRQEIVVQHGSNILHPSDSSDTTTSSRLRAWYLVRFRGYTVTQRKEIPKVTRLGRLTYECQWHLRAEIGPPDTVS